MSKDSNKYPLLFGFEYQPNINEYQSLKNIYSTTTQLNTSLMLI